MKNTLYLLFTVCLFQVSGNAQIFDVFQNKEYKYSTYVLEGKSDKEYVPANLEILQDKNKEEDTQWRLIEKQLYTIALQHIEDEVAFFKLRTKASSYLERLDQFNRIADPYYQSTIINPKFKSIEIKLVSVVNNRGVYFIQYDFGDVDVKKFYLTDYQNNKVIEINETHNLRQQEILKKTTLTKLTTLYLLQTKKLEISDIDRIRATQSGEENLIDLSNRIVYSEALVYPFFTGIIVEFPAYSKSSEIFENNAFRILLKGKELVELLEVFPEFKSSFRQPLKQPSLAIIEALNNDKNFDILRFSRAPKEIQLLESLSFFQTNKKPFSLTINNYHKRDTTKTFRGTKKIFFDKNGNILRVEERNDKNDIIQEEKYSYNENNKLTDIRFSGYDTKLKLQNYDIGLLSHIETIEIDDYETAYGTDLQDINIYEQHFAFNNHHRYTLEFNVVGDFDQDRTIQNRYITSNEYCTYRFCLLTDDNEQVIAVKGNIGSLIDILLNANNQPIESFLDRYHYKFTYDNDNRITSFSSTFNGISTSFVEYQYYKNIEKPLTIIETKTNLSTTIMIQEYEIAFWED